MNLVTQLMRHEGFRGSPYLDTVGKLTIGYGRNLDDVGISETEGTYLLANDIQNARNDIAKAFSWTSKMDQVRRDALTNMCFNMGIEKLKGFPKMLAALQAGNWKEAAKQALNSKWATQVGGRANDLAKQFITGEYQ